MLLLTNVRHWHWSWVPELHTSDARSPGLHTSQHICCSLAARVLPLAHAHTGSHCAQLSVSGQSESDTGHGHISTPPVTRDHELGSDMYAPNQYYQPYTGSEGRSRRNSSSAGSVVSENNNSRLKREARHADPGPGGRGLCSLRCCCVGLALVLVIGASVAGILSWVLSRETLSSKSHRIDTSRNTHIVNDNLSDIFSLLESKSDKSNPDKDKSMQLTINNKFEFSTTTRKPTHSSTSKRTLKAISSTQSTTTERITTYGPQYTQIISKMKEMRKQRLSNKYFGAEESRNDEVERDQTTEAMTEQPTTTRFPIFNSESVEDIEENKTPTPATDILLETTTTKLRSPEDFLKSSKFLRFEKEVLLNYTRSERNHRNKPSEDDNKGLNQIPATKGEKEDQPLNSVASTGILQTPSSVMSSVTRAESTSDKAFFAYPDIVTYTIDQSTVTQGNKKLEDRKHA